AEAGFDPSHRWRGRRGDGSSDPLSLVRNPATGPSCCSLLRGRSRWSVPAPEPPPEPLATIPSRLAGCGAAIRSLPANIWVSPPGRALPRLLDGGEHRRIVDGQVHAGGGGQG